MLRNTAIVAARMGRAAALVALEASPAWRQQPLGRQQEYRDIAFEQAAANGQTATTWAAINLYLQTYDNVVAGTEPVELLREFIERALVLGAAGGHATLASSVLVGTISSTLVELDRRAAAAAVAAAGGQRPNPDDDGEGGDGDAYNRYAGCADPSCTMCGTPPTLFQLAATEKRLKQAASVVETLEAAGYCMHLDPTRATRDDCLSDDGGGPSDAAYYSDEVRLVS